MTAAQFGDGWAEEVPPRSRFNEAVFCLGLAFHLTFEYWGSVRFIPYGLPHELKADTSLPRLDPYLLLVSDIICAAMIAYAVLGDKAGHALRWREPPPAETGLQRLCNFLQPVWQCSLLMPVLCRLSNPCFLYTLLRQLHASNMSFLWVFALWQCQNLAVNFAHHRMYAHTSYTCSRALGFLMAAFACVQKGPLWWASNHRAHHRDCDSVKDPHSLATRGFGYAHIGWIADPRYCKVALDELGATRERMELLLLDAFYPLIVMAWNWVWSKWLTALHVGDSTGHHAAFWLAYAFSLHFELFINSACHSDDPASSKIETRFKGGQSEKCIPLDQWWVGILNAGEGWHANHHKNPKAWRHAHEWYQLDLTALFVQAMSLIGLVRLPQQGARAGRRAVQQRSEAYPDKAE